jgi:peptide/nickel transport system permease protein
LLQACGKESRTDRTLSTVAITTTATPEYVSGVIFIAVFSSSAFGLKWFKGSAATAMENPTFENFFLPVRYHCALWHGLHRADDARLNGRSDDRTIHPYRAPKGCVLWQYRYETRPAQRIDRPLYGDHVAVPVALNGVVIVETLFNYKGFGWVLVQAAGNNDIELLLAVSVVSVVVVLVTQLISDIGYVYLNPRISVN